ncbi:MAG: hypothetical protein M1820_003313 [Bogoriella megaspora]|nr:MAG: hypothetical protein M1820_003313 [Bogoriella megaspora]
MPHKHTRSRTSDANQFELPPTTLARPLPVGKQASNPSTGNLKRRRNLSKQSYNDNDTPKAFTRLLEMQQGGKKMNGLDDGSDRISKKRKLKLSEEKDEPKRSNLDAPKILPHERLSDFAARVDQALPLSKLGRQSKALGGIRGRQTKKEKKMQKIYADWRRQDAVRREKEEEAREVAEEEEEDLQASTGGEVFPAARKGHKGKRRHIVEADDDPWEVLKERRDQPRGLNDIVQAPPQLKNIPREKFKIKQGARVEVANVPNAAGSLRRREELGETRKSVIEQYRQMMNTKRAS